MDWLLFQQTPAGNVRRTKGERHDWGLRVCKGITEFYKQWSAGKGGTASFLPVIATLTHDTICVGLWGWGDLDLLSNLTCCHGVRSNMYKKPPQDTDILGAVNVTLIGTQSSDTTASNWRGMEVLGQNAWLLLMLFELVVHKDFSI